MVKRLNRTRSSGSRHGSLPAFPITLFAATAAMTETVVGAPAGMAWLDGNCAAQGRVRLVVFYYYVLELEIEDIPYRGVQGEARESPRISG